ncbi:hypothetical protein [Acanthopleuribacter pedis]|uniref:Adenosine deaminase n=1 Tax=Acanthopleuribacter pedis TaxID=442870 RepID=A0A8J7U452_9BACT|nr:hypothetical protein [Acanthopleuribacter pedis]MBO1319454.1 hypothetical protein [Acanthopleuribacter pedis]
MKQLLQQLALSAPSLLRVYYRDGVLPLEELKTRVFVRARQLKPHWADYRFKNYEGLAFRQTHTEATTAECLWQLAETYFEFRDTEIRCCIQHFEAWQRCLTRLPPLPLLVAAVYQQHATGPDLETLFTNNFLKHSFLPSIYHPLLEDLIQEEGLNELHLHLNGTTEFDFFWQDALAFPDRVYRNLAEVFKADRREVYELYTQIDPELTAADVRLFLAAACRIRDYLVRYLYQGTPYPEDLGAHVLFCHHHEQPLLQRGDRHPLATLLPLCRDWPATACEAMLLMAVYAKIDAGDRTTARLFHQYLLIQGYFNRLLVQQGDQVGFDQFQKITLNEIREFSEIHYLKRFRQLKGRYGNDLAFLEGRFAPKANGEKTLGLIKRIHRDYQQFLRDEASHSKGATAVSPCAPRPFELKLTAHLIKKKAPEAGRGRDGNPDVTHYSGCRHASLRRELVSRTRRLANVSRGREDARNLVAGLDAASNEQHALPEVFAPAFRLFRRRGFLDFTYHAGEDFVHLVSGMRVIWEAAAFLDFRAGNRIGHATAIGIHPSLWTERCGEVLLPITRHEWLDNLVFAYMLLSRRHEFSGRLPALRGEIAHHFAKIYRPPVYFDAMPEPAVLIDAWRMRDLDGLLLGEDLVDFEVDRFYRRFLDQDQRVEAKRLWQRQKTATRAFSLWRCYHHQDVVARGGELIEVPIDFFAEVELTALQAAVITDLNQRSIALESMPTSNVAISYYRNYREHHLFRWLGIPAAGNDLPEPIVVLASDNPGIFANNLRNDFSHIFVVMTRDLELSPNEAISQLRKLNRNGRIFRFGRDAAGSPPDTPPGLADLLAPIS